MRVDLYKSGGYGGGGISQNGGNITGSLLLAGNPSQTLEAVPKQYVDAYFTSINANNFSSGTLNSARLPAFTGGDLTTSAGSSVTTLSDTGIVAGTYGKVTVNSKGRVTAGGDLTDADLPFGISWNKVTSGKPTTLSGYGVTNGISKAGGTLTGFLTINDIPTLGSHAVNKTYVNTIAGGGGIAVGDIIRKPFDGTPSGFLRCNGAELDKTTYAALYSVIGDNFNVHTTAGSGKPWQQQYQINTTQSTDITGWTTGTALPLLITSPQVIVTKNRVYLIGGNNLTNAINNVYYAPINADGTLGAWVAGTSTPFTIAYAPTIVIKNRVYIISGWSSHTYPGLIYTAPINSDGSLGTWSTYGNAPAGGYNAQSIVTKNRVYLMGGYNGSNIATDLVYSAPIGSDGSIGTWVQETSLPVILPNTSTVVTKNRIYLCGGYNGNSVYTATVWTAPINTDGTIGAWTTANPLPEKFSYSSVLVTKNRVYLIGGYNGSNTVSTVYTAAINADGTLGTWTIGTSLPGPFNTAIDVSVVTKNRIHIFGGHNGTSYLTTVYTAPIAGGLNDYSSYYAEDTTNYMTIGSGKPWQQQYEINTTQSTDITGWTAGTALPGTLGASQALVTKNRVYLLGGESSGSVSTVYTAPINSDGTLGTWGTDTSLPGPVSNSACIVTKNRVYLLGGANGATYLSSIYTAPINTDGTLGTWTTDSNSLPILLSQSRAIITKNRVYLLGGANGGGYLSTVYTATINSDGTIGGWLSYTSLPTILCHHGVIITKNRIYLIGGQSSGVTNSTVYTATINSNGEIGAWTTSSSLPGQLGYSSILCTKNRVYVMGGYTSGYSNVVYTAPINSDGTLGAWITGTSVPISATYTTAFIVKNKVYLCGGFATSANVSSVYSANISSDISDYSPYYDDTIGPKITDVPNYLMPGSGKPWQQQYQINTTQSTDITGWTTGTALPTSFSASQAIVTKNRVYLCGGAASGSYVSTVYTAPINTDGTLGTWATATSLPGTLGWATAIVTKGRVYLLGGTNGTTTVSTVYTAPINSDGTLGTWVTDTSLPGILGISQAIVTKNRLYLSGGITTGGTYVSTVYTAPINSDGTLGTWTTGTSIPGALSYSQAIVTKNRVYLLGGHNGTSALSIVYTASISSDGTLGTWVIGTSLPGTLYASQAIVTKNRVYLLGGHVVGGAAVSTVYTAPINSDGTLGTWTTGTSIPGALGVSQAIITNSRIYLLGGYDGGFALSTVYTATILEGLNDLSPYYDGTITPAVYVDPNGNKFLIPDASADEPFGSYSYIKY